MYPQGLPPDSVLPVMQKSQQQGLPLLCLKEVIRDWQQPGALGEGMLQGHKPVEGRAGSCPALTVIMPGWQRES